MCDIMVLWTLEYGCQIYTFFKHKVEDEQWNMNNQDLKIRVKNLDEEQKHTQKSNEAM